MSAFLFYKPDSNPSRFSRKERFSLHLASNSTSEPGNTQGDEDCLYSNRIATSDNISSPASNDSTCDNRAYERPSGAEYTWAPTPSLCDMQSNGFGSLATLSVPPDTENAYSSNVSERGLREVSNFSEAIDHHHRSSVSSIAHARPLLREGPVPTIEQNFSPQGSIGNNDDLTSLRDFDEELGPLWNSVNGSRSPPASLQPLSGTHSRDPSLARGTQESTNSNTIDLNLSTGRAFDTQYYLRLVGAQREMDDLMQLDYPVAQTLKDLEHAKSSQNSLNGSAPAESEAETGSMWPENQNLMLNDGPPSPSILCKGLSLQNDIGDGLLDQPPEEYQYVDPRSTAYQDSASSKKETNSALTTRLDRYDCSESPGHAHPGQNICHNDEISSDEVPEDSALHHFSQSAGTVFDTGLETEHFERITLPNHTRLTDGPDTTEPTLHSHRTRNKQVVFSHVEIRNPKIVDKGNKSARLAPQCDGLYPENTCPIPSTNPHYPWSLSGTTLSIDIRKAERLPIAVGYSAFRVVDGQLFQILTLSQGNVGSPWAKGQSRDSSVPIYSAENRTRSNRIWTSAKRGPLSPTEKRKLVALRNNGYTWNEIATRFPQRKRGTLQSVYYSQMKSTRDRVTLTHEGLWRSHSPRNSRHSVLSGGSESTSISADEARSEPISHSRYSFRPRRGPRF